MSVIPDQYDDVHWGPLHHQVPDSQASTSFLNVLFKENSRDALPLIRIMSPTTFISNVGGLLGLFFGFSGKL